MMGLQMYNVQMMRGLLLLLLFIVAVESFSTNTPTKKPTRNPTNKKIYTFTISANIFSNTSSEAIRARLWTPDLQSLTVTDRVRNPGDPTLDYATIIARKTRNNINFTAPVPGMIVSFEPYYATADVCKENKINKCGLISCVDTLIDPYKSCFRNCFKYPTCVRNNKIIKITALPSVRTSTIRFSSFTLQTNTGVQPTLITVSKNQPEDTISVQASGNPQGLVVRSPNNNINVINLAGPMSVSLENISFSYAVGSLFASVFKNSNTNFFSRLSLPVSSNQSHFSMYTSSSLLTTLSFTSTFKKKWNAFLESTIDTVSAILPAVVTSNIVLTTNNNRCALASSSIQGSMRMSSTTCSVDNTYAAAREMNIRFNELAFANISGNVRSANISSDELSVRHDTGVSVHMTKDIRAYSSSNKPGTLFRVATYGSDVVLSSSPAGTNTALLTPALSLLSWFNIQSGASVDIQHRPDAVVMNTKTTADIEYQMMKSPVSSFLLDRYTSLTDNRRSLLPAGSTFGVQGTAKVMNADSVELFNDFAERTLTMKVNNRIVWAKNLNYNINMNLDVSELSSASGGTQRRRLARVVRSKSGKAVVYTITKGVPGPDVRISSVDLDTSATITYKDGMLGFKSFVYGSEAEVNGQFTMSGNQVNGSSTYSISQEHGQGQGTFQFIESDGGSVAATMTAPSHDGPMDVSQSMHALNSPFAIRSYGTAYNQSTTTSCSIAADGTFSTAIGTNTLHTELGLQGSPDLFRGSVYSSSSSAVGMTGTMTANQNRSIDIQSFTVPPSVSNNNTEIIQTSTYGCFSSQCDHKKLAETNASIYVDHGGTRRMLRRTLSRLLADTGRVASSSLIVGGGVRIVGGEIVGLTTTLPLPTVAGQNHTASTSGTNYSHQQQQISVTGTGNNNGAVTVQSDADGSTRMVAALDYAEGFTASIAGGASLGWSDTAGTTGTLTTNIDPTGAISFQADQQQGNKNINRTVGIQIVSATSSFTAFISTTSSQQDVVEPEESQPFQAFITADGATSLSFSSSSGINTGISILGSDGTFQNVTIDDNDTPFSANISISETGEIQVNRTELPPLIDTTPTKTPTSAPVCFVITKTKELVNCPIKTRAPTTLSDTCPSSNKFTEVWVSCTKNEHPNDFKVCLFCSPELEQYTHCKSPIKDIISCNQTAPENLQPFCDTSLEQLVYEKCYN